MYFVQIKLTKRFLTERYMYGEILQKFRVHGDLNAFDKCNKDLLQNNL